jgi:integrase
VTPADVAAAIRPVYERGARVQADKVRMYVGAAFRWGFQAAHDYRAAQPVDWGILSNPVEAVPRDTEAERVGSRFLSEAELVALLTWARLGRSRSRKAIALLALTGQRVREVVEIKSSQWDRSGRLLSWARTKNGKPHVLPVCEEAAAILDSLRPDADGWLFPALGGRPGPMRDAAVLKALKAYARWAGVPAFSGRDLRRTWKTLAGKAGLTKTERDLLQNHGAGDVSSRHYDRFDYLPEKRAAVARWAAWLQEQVREHRAKKRADHVVDGKQEKNGQGVAAV